MSPGAEHAPESEEEALMLAGKPYLASDQHLVNLRARCRKYIQKYNTLIIPDQLEEATELLKELTEGRTAVEKVFIEPPFRCDGRNLRFGKNVYMNFGCVILDCAKVTFGDNVLLAPNVQIYAATHPLDHIERRGRELAYEITIGDDVWIGGGAIILPGVTIGSRSVVGAGSVVTKSVPEDVVVAGNPARVIRHIKQSTTAA
ncbi:maltose o-acetyltransferase [Cladochytrium replicatum]|nr:maltose o-acetyltransferase [Cladochytrium replicatum]